MTFREIPFYLQHMFKVSSGDIQKWEGPLLMLICVLKHPSSPSVKIVGIYVFALTYKCIFIYVQIIQRQLWLCNNKMSGNFHICSTMGWCIYANHWHVKWLVKFSQFLKNANWNSSSISTRIRYFVFQLRTQSEYKCEMSKAKNVCINIWYPFNGFSQRWVF